MSKKIKNIAVVGLCTAWVFGLFLWEIVSPDREISASERRKLQQMPKISGESIADGNFMSDFEKYSADQFPLRESFRRIKSIGEYYIFNQSDSNDVYMYKGYASKLDYPLDVESVEYAASRIQFIYDKFLKGKAENVYLSIVPDKNYFMKKSGALTVDFDELVSLMRKRTDFAEYIDIFPALELSDYYKTDTHWRQECISDAAKTLAEGLGVSLKMEYTLKDLVTDLYGVLYGQSALPMPGEKMYYIWNDAFEDVTVYNLEEQGYTPLYDLEKAQGMDPYEIYLSGPRSCMTIENPSASTDKTLIIIRDSFGSSMAPYLIEAYKKIVLLDIRYLPAPMLNRYADFEGADVLFMYSTLILNSSETLT